MQQWQHTAAGENAAGGASIYVGINALLRDFYDLSGLVIPFAFHPITALELVFPNMWPFSISSYFSPARDIKSLAGKVILVTGG